MDENAARIVAECIREKKARLDLRGCNLAGDDLDTIFIPFRHSRQEYAHITEISLRDTAITVLPECTGSFSALKILDAGNTGLSELPESIANLSGLESLLLDYTHIVRLPEALLRLRFLKKVVVYDNIIL
jgi:Leucine-rich repeat (LRR) protein